MTKVLHVITDTNIGGAGKILINFLQRYNKKEFNISVAIPQNSLLKNELTKIGCVCFEIPHIADKSLSFKAIGALITLFKKEKPHIVHTHASMSARIAARIFSHNCKIVYTRHSVFDVPAYKTRFPYKQLNGFINNIFADGIIAVSPAAKDNITDVGVSPKKVHVVFNGVDTVKVLSNEEKLKVRDFYGINKDDFVCAIIARLEKVKGHEYIIQACKKLSLAHPDVKVIIAGTGSEEANLKALADGMGNCIFAGFVNDVYKIENIMDVQLNASYGTEATSTSLLEGMSLGIPSIVSDFGGNPYVIQNNINGYIIPKKNPDALYNAIVELKNDTARYNIMKQNCKEIFNKTFTSDSMARETENVYKFLKK